MSPILILANQESNKATTYENYPSDLIHDCKSTKEVATEKKSSSPRADEESLQDGNDGVQQNPNRERQQPPQYASIVAEIEARCEAKFGLRVAALEKQYRILNRLFSAMPDTSLGWFGTRLRTTEWAQHNKLLV